MAITIKEIRHIVFKTRRGRKYRVLFVIRGESVFVTNSDHDISAIGVREELLQLVSQVRIGVYQLPLLGLQR